MSIGIICEYNPFHNGHIYHLNKVKELKEDDTIILILSGNYTQRGDISIIEKYDKTSIALKYGADLVIELPYEFATESSDFFAKGALQLLNELKCEKLVFGSESNNIENIINLANIQLNNSKYDELVKNYLDNGINYPTAMSNALSKISSITIKEPNDLLALSYVKEIIMNKYKIIPITIKRTNNYNEKNLTGNISSATSIREAIKKGNDYSKAIPPESYNSIIKYNENQYFNILKYKIIEDNNLSIYQGVDEGLENKIKKEILNCSNLEELIKKIKSKRYTYNKIKRMLTHIICSYTKEESKNSKNIKYIRVLGFSQKGKKYLNIIKKESSLPIITNINKKNIDLLNREIKSDLIYYMIINKQNNIFKQKPIIKRE